MEFYNESPPESLMKKIKQANVNFETNSYSKTEC